MKYQKFNTLTAQKLSKWIYFLCKTTHNMNGNHYHFTVGMVNPPLQLIYTIIKITPEAKLKVNMKHPNMRSFIIFVG